MHVQHRVAARVLAVAGFLGGLLALTAPAQAADTCQATPMVNPSTSAAYTVTVCLSAPGDGATLSGSSTVTGTISFAGTSPGVQRMVYSLNGEYLLTDYSAPYTFTLKTQRFVDGTYTLAVHALLRDTNSTPDTTVTVTFDNGVTTPPVNTNTFSPPQGNPVAPGTTFTVGAAGDGAGGEASETAVTNLIAGMNPHLTLYLGDVYEKGTQTEYDNWYGLNQPDNTFYGRFRDITLPTIGNHEYTAGQAPGYFDYWDNAPHYYSVNRHGWHIISLDTNAAYNQTAVGSGQYQWLANDLATNTQPCTLAFYHQPRWNIGDEGPSTNVQPIWALLAQNGVDLVVNGHDHTYQRFRPLDANGSPDPAGVTELLDGAGGHAIGGLPLTDPNLVTSAQQFGALKLGLNPAGASYQFVGTSGAVVDSGSVKCDTTTADGASPSTPSGLVATATYKTRVDLSWTESTDNVGVTQYRILRDGAVLDTVQAGSSYADTSVAPGSTHTYQVRAVDAAGNASAASNAASATTPTVAVLFHDGFESGDLSQWQNPGGTTNPPNAGLTAQSTDTFAGAFAARASSADGTNGSSAWKTLSQPETSLFYVARFKAVSHNTSVNLMRMRAGTASSSPVLTVGLSSTNRVTLRNDGGTTPATTTSATVASPGTWHTLQVHATVNGLLGATEVWLDGTRLSDLSLVTADLGSNAIAKVELGDPGSTTTAKTFDVRFDEVAYDREQIGDLTAPTAPTNLTATAASGLAVDLAWTAATDDVGVSGYDVYRNGALLTSIPAGTSYRDASVSPGAAYTYQILARDAAGNVPGLSNSASVQTGDIFSDGFESGDLSKWTSVSGLVASQSLVDTGAWAARGTSDGSAGASAVVNLDSGVSDLYYRLRFRQVSQGANTATLARMRTAGNAAIATVYVGATGRLGYRNDVAGAATNTTTVVAPGIWHELQFHVNVDSGLVEVWLDGVAVASAPEPLGSSPIAKLELGEPTVGRTFDYAFDGVFASPAFVQDTAVPTAPGSLHVTGVTANAVSLAWDAASDDVGVVTYRVFRDGTPVGDVDGGTTTYDDTSAAPNGTYTYRVYALDAVGHRSDASNAVTVDTPDTQPPAPPTGLAGTAQPGQISLSWSAATDNRGVVGYRVYRAGQSGPLADLGTVLSYVDTTVASGTSYTYTVTALDAAGNESAPSAAAIVASSDTQAPTAPGTPTVTGASDSSVTVTWAAATDDVGVATYLVYRDGGASPVGTVAGASLAFTNTGLAADSQHSYTVKARDAAGNVSPASGAGTGRALVFTDGFETGNLSRWNSGGTLQVQTGFKYAGSYGARANSPRNSAIFATKTLPATYTDLTYDVRFFLNTGRQDTTNLLRFRTAAGGNLLALVSTNNKKLALRNDTNGQLTISGVSVPVGVWTEAKVRVVINGANSQVTVWLNGAQVAALSGTRALGTTAIGQIVAGESTAGSQYDVIYDDVRITRTP